MTQSRGRRRNGAPLGRRLYRRLRRLPLPDFVKRRLFPHGPLHIAIDEAHSFVMLSEGDHIEADLYQWGFGRGWEGMSLRTWTCLARNARTILDIGSLHGVYALSAKAVSPQARVIAFEPVEISYRRLLGNIELNGFDIAAERVAVSDSTGKAVMFDSALTLRHNLSSLARPPKIAYSEIEVPTTTLDEYLERTGQAMVDLIKIDVEGHESAVLRGMAGLLANSRPTLLVEILTEGAGEAVLSLLDMHGYGAYLISEFQGLEPVTSITSTVRGSRNFLFCRPEVFAAAGLAELLIGA